MYRHTCRHNTCTYKIQINLKKEKEKFKKALPGLMEVLSILSAALPLTYLVHSAHTRQPGNTLFIFFLNIFLLFNNFIKYILVKFSLSLILPRTSLTSQPTQLHILFLNLLNPLSSVCVCGLQLARGPAPECFQYVRCHVINEMNFSLSVASSCSAVGGSWCSLLLPHPGLSSDLNLCRC